MLWNCKTYLKIGIKDKKKKAVVRSMVLGCSEMH